MKNFTIKSVELDGEFREVLRILTENFPKHSLSFHRNRFLNDPTCSPSSTRILVKDKKIVSTLRIYRRYMYNNGKKLLFGGIGNVATIREKQRLGYASILLRSTIDLLRSRGFPLVVLFTRLNEFYEKFGFRTVIRRNYIISREFVRNHPVTLKIVPVRQFTSKIIRTISNIYKRNYSNFVGPNVRTLNYWNSQLKFRQDDPDKFLLGVKNNRIVSFIRGKRYDKEIAIFDLASQESMSESFRDFLVYYFEKFEPQFISLIANRKLASLLGIERLKYDTQNELMIKTFRDNFKRHNISQLESKLFDENKILIWQSDFF